MIANTLGFITEDQFAELAQVKLSTLDAWRRRHMGPAWSRMGNAILYRQTDIVAFIESNQRGGAVSLK